MSVFVLDASKRPLMPCTSSAAPRHKGRGYRAEKKMELAVMDRDLNADRQERASRLTTLRKTKTKFETRADMARFLGIHTDTYRKLESGERIIDDDWAYKIAPKLGVTPEYMLFGDAPKKCKHSCKTPVKA